MNSIPVDVIVPVYNNSFGISQLIESLMHQKYPRDMYTVIIVDNNSTDNTREVIKSLQDEYPKRIKLYLESSIQSSYAARNKGIKMSSAKALAFTDSDCIPENSWLVEGVHSLLDSNSSVIGGKVEFTYKKEKPNVYEIFDSCRKMNQKKYAEEVGFAATANMFVESSIFEEYGYFRNDLVSGGDYEFGRRIHRQGGSIFYSDKSVVKHPARYELSGILKKTKRVALGQKSLERLGLLEHNKLSIKQLKPSLFNISVKDHDSCLNFNQYFLLNVLHNLNRWMNFFYRV